MKWYTAIPLTAAALLAAACSDSAPTAVTSQLAPRSPSLAVNGVTGASFTSTNVAVDNADGNTTVCRNGTKVGDANNCNIYADKRYVWIEGGPIAAGLEDGDYFFAVLVPGGQVSDVNDANPISAIDKNLSDDKDAYTNRTFTVSGGAITAYGGTHDFDNGRIRLFDYLDTSNPGGEYDVAVCRVDAYPVQTGSPCKYDNFKVRTPTECPNVEASDCQFHSPATLSISKDISTTFTRTFGWGITKDVDKTTVTLNGKGSATFNYTVNVTHNTGTDAGWAYSGTITVTNGPSGTATNVTVSDPGATIGTCTPAQGSTLIPNASMTCAYSGTKTSGADFANQATVSWNTTDINGNPTNPSATSDPVTGNFTTPTTVVDKCVSVTDPVAGGILPATLCADVAASPTTYKYSRIVAYDQAKVPSCVPYDNTATFTTTDVGGTTTGSASKTVSVCFYNAPFTIGYWSNHLANQTKGGPYYSADCAKVPSGGSCSNNGPWAIQYLSALTLGNYLVGNITNATNVFASNNCSNASTSDQNAVGCLTAQLLAAKLNVANSANTCISGVIGFADSFLKAGTVTYGGFTAAGVVYTGPSGKYTLTATGRSLAVALKSALDDYNNAKGCITAP